MIQYLKLSLIARHTVEILKMEGWIVKRFVKCASTGTITPVSSVVLTG